MTTGLLNDEQKRRVISRIQECAGADEAYAIEGHISALESDLEAHRAANGMAACAYCDWRQPAPGGGEARKAALRDHVTTCQKHHIRGLEQHTSDLEKSLENVRADRDAAVTELARLRPSGEVAEDERAVLAFIGAHPSDAPTRDAAHRLAAKAHGYEAAVADNAALLQALQEHAARLQCSVCGGVGAHEAVDDVWFCEQGPTTLTQHVAAVLAAPHPGTAMLEQHREALAAAERRHETTRATMHVREEQHRKALIRERNEGLEAVALRAEELAEGQAGGVLRVLRWVAKDARDMKEPAQ